MANRLWKNNKVTIYIYADFEYKLVSEDNGNQNSKESYSNKHQKHVSCSHGY